MIPQILFPRSLIQLSADLREILAFMKRSGIRMRFFARSFGFSFALALFNLYTISLLFPLVNNIISGDWSGMGQMRFVGYFVREYPGIFQGSLRLFLLLVTWVYATIVLKNLLQYAATVSTNGQARQATARLRELLIDKCLSFGKSFYDENKVSFVHDTIAHASRVIEGQFRLVQDLLIQTLLILIYVGIMLNISWKLTLVSVIVFPFMGTLTRRIIDRIREYSRMADSASLDLSDRILNILYCLPTVKGFAKEGEEKESFRKASARELDETFRVQRLQGLIGPVEDIGATTGTLLLACGMALVLYFDHSMAAPHAFVFFYVATKLIPALNSINGFRMGAADSTIAMKKVMKVLDESDHHAIVGGSRPFAGLERSIEIKDLSFAYPGTDRPVLKGVSFVIEKGRTTAIVGPTGSGKSTIANLLLGFYAAPAAGVLIDGVDIADYEPHSLRQRISFVGQDILLFNTTLDHNIRYAADRALEDAQVHDVGMRTGVHEFVSRLPQGYATAVSDRGSNFSGGEKQRVAVARALLRESDILILDEATSSLDAVTEERVNRAIAESSRGKTVIIISHRLSAIRSADRIVYLDQGQVVEQGTFAEVLAREGDFYRQWRLQTAG